MMKSRFLFLLSLTAFILLPKVTFTHCEIPCGIYDDEIRFSLLAEDITTIEKSMIKIAELSDESKINYNQLVRWITNKEEHATKFTGIITQYFMTQRIKVVEPGDDGYDDYVKKVTLMHKMIRGAMKCKQTTDPENPAALRSMLKEFEKLYLADHSH